MDYDSVCSSPMVYYNKNEKTITYIQCQIHNNPQNRPIPKILGVFRYRPHNRTRICLEIGASPKW